MKTMTRKRAITWLVAILTFAVAMPAEAQRQGRRGGPPGERDRAQLEQRIRAQMGRVIRERLGLNDEEAERLGEIVRQFGERRGVMRREEEAIRRRVEALMLEGADDEEEAIDLLGRMADLRRAEVELVADEQEALLEVLEPLQLLRFQIFRDQLADRIRRIRSGGMPPGGPGERGPPGILPER